MTTNDRPRAPPTVDVVFRAPEHRAHVEAGHTVHVVGDFPDFRVPHLMHKGCDGVPTLTLSLSPGVYRYKLLLNLTTWVLPVTTTDGGAPRTECVDGFENAVLVVGGQRDPVFAPDARHRRRGDDGALLLRAEVVKRVDDEKRNVCVTVWGDDGSRVKRALDVVGERGDRRLLHGRVPLTKEHAGTFSVHFDDDGAERERVDESDDDGAERERVDESDDDGANERRRTYALPTASTHVTPQWARDATLLFVLVDRWHRGANSPVEKRARKRTHPSYPSVFYGGDLDGVRESIPHLVSLGVDALVLSPVHPSPTPHRYDGTDLLRTDDAIGGERALTGLIDDAHAVGLKIVIDLAVTHVNHQHPFFKDVLARQHEAAHLDFFRLKSFPVRRRDPSTYEHYWDCIDLPWLALENPRPAAHALDVARRYASLGVDGLRLDAMLDAPLSFWRTLTKTLRREFPSLWMLGEVVGDNFAPFIVGDDDDGVHTATDGRFRERMLRLLMARNSEAACKNVVATFASDLVVDAHRAGVFPDSGRAIFLDTHDTGRFLSRVGDDDALAFALVLAAFMPHPWLLTYGTECGLAAHVDEPALDGAWAERLPMPALDVARRHPLFAATRDALALRRALRTSHAGPMTVRGRGDVGVFERTTSDDAVWTLTLGCQNDACAEPGVNAYGHILTRRAGLLTVTVHRRRPSMP